MGWANLYNLTDRLAGTPVSISRGEIWGSRSASIVCFFGGFKTFASGSTFVKETTGDGPVAMEPTGADYLASRS